MVLPAGSHVLLTGGTGFIGHHLCPLLLAWGLVVTVLTRDLQRAQNRLPDSIQLIDHIGQLERMPPVDAIINLAGEPLAGGRWNESRKRLFEQSRTGLTQQLFRYFSEQSTTAPKVLVSGSAVGYYGPQKDVMLCEDDEAEPSYSHELCSGWENVACMFELLYTRVVRLRTGVVLGDGGVLPAMMPAFKAGFGGPMASGNQWMSWIHIEDMVRIIKFCLHHPDIHGPVNAVAPHPVTNREFARQLGRALHRPALFRIPTPVLKLLFGEMAQELLINGQRVVPAKLLKAGYNFTYPELDKALRQIFAK